MFYTYYLVNGAGAGLRLKKGGSGRLRLRNPACINNENKN